MSISSDSAEQVTRMVLQGEEICLKATGKAAKELIALIAAIMKSQTQTKGKTRLTNLLKSGKELKVFSVKKEDLQLFMQEAKRYGVLYSALVDKHNKNFDGIVDIMVRAEDASKINRIVTRFNIATVNETEIKTEIDKDREDKTPLLKKDTKENLLKSSSRISKVPEENTKKSVRQELQNIKQEIFKEKQISSPISITHNINKTDKIAR